MSSKSNYQPVLGNITVLPTGAGTPSTSSVISSIQYAVITVTSLSTTGTATITAIDTNNTTLHLLGSKVNSSSGTTAHSTACYVQLTNSTTITATRSTNLAAYTISVGVMIIEWASGVLVGSVQRGVASIGSGTITRNTTITSVSTSRAVASYLGTSSDENGAFSPGISFAKVRLTSSTNIRAERQQSSNNIEVSWEVYEFSSSWVSETKETQTESVSTNNVTLLQSDTTTSYNTNNAILLLRGFYSSDVLGGLAAITSYSSETIIGQVFPKTSGSSGGYNTCFTLVMFNQSVINKRCLRLLKHVGGTGEPDTLVLSDSYSSTKSALFWLGTSSSLATYNPYKFLCIGSFSAPSTLSSDRGQDVDDSNQSLELIEFN